MGDDRAMTDAERLREFLATRDAPCPSCGYNLRGIVTGVCPECGYRPRLHPAAKRLAPLPLPTHLRVAMALQSGLGVTVSVVGPVHRADTFGMIAMLGLAMVVATVLWYGAWRVGSAVSGSAEPWKLSVLGAVLWIGVFASAVVLAVLL